MPRKPRLFVPGATYHVYCRVARGEFVFENPDNAEAFLEGCHAHTSTLVDPSPRIGVANNCANVYVAPTEIGHRPTGGRLVHRCCERGHHETWIAWSENGVRCRSPDPSGFMT